MRYTYVYILLLMSSCHNDNAIDLNKCPEMQLKQIYCSGSFNKLNATDCIDGCDHYLLVENYDKHCLNDYDFIRAVYKYIDTLTLCKPVASITFCSKSFTDIPDDQDWGYIRKLNIFDVYFCTENIGQMHPKISSISIWENGKYRAINFNCMY